MNFQNPNLNKFSAKRDDNHFDDENDRGSLSHLWWSFSKLKLKVWRWEWQFWVYKIFIFFNFQRREMTITLTMRMIVAAFLICHSLKLGLNCYEIATNFMGILHFYTQLIGFYLCLCLCSSKILNWSIGISVHLSFLRRLSNTFSELNFEEPWWWNNFPLQYYTPPEVWKYHICTLFLPWTMNNVNCQRLMNSDITLT